MQGLSHTTHPCALATMGTATSAAASLERAELLPLMLLVLLLVQVLPLMLLRLLLQGLLELLEHGLLTVLPSLQLLSRLQRRLSPAGVILLGGGRLFSAASRAATWLLNSACVGATLAAAAVTSAWKLLSLLKRQSAPRSTSWALRLGRQLSGNSCKRDDTEQGIP